MAKIQLIRGGSSKALMQRAADFLAQLPADSEVVMVGATRQAADEFARDCCAGGRLGLHRMTLGQMAATLAAPAAGESGLGPLTQLSLEALTARVVHRAGRKLRYFSPVAAMPGFARALAATILELRLDEVAAEELAQTGLPGKDLALLLEAYETELRERRLADLALLLKLAGEAAASGEHRYAGLPLMFLDVPVRSALRKNLITALVKRSPAVVATVLEGDQETRKALVECLGVQADQVTDDASATTLGRIRLHLFQPEPGAGAERDETLEMFSAPGEGLECVEIARRIRRAASGGVPFDRVAVLLRNPERYQPLLEEALRRAGIPGYYSRGTLRPDPGGRAFLALMACAWEGCTATRFAEYLSLAQVPELDETGAPLRTGREWGSTDDEVLAGFGRTGAAMAPAAGFEPAASLSTPAGWERLLVDAAVVGGKSRWERRLRGLENELQFQLQAAGDEDASETEALGRRLAQLRRLEQFALPVIDLLDNLPKLATWGEWIEKLTELAETALRHPEAILSVLNELRPMSEVGPAELEEVYTVLSNRLRFLRRQPPARRYGRVFVGSIEEARGRCFDLVFVPGLAEGVFPRRAQEDPLLLDVHREKLNGRLRVQDDRVVEERLLLHTSAGAAAGKLVVSYSRIDAVQSRPRVPSFYALEVVRAAEGRLPDLGSFGKQMAQAAPSRLGWPAPLDSAQSIDEAEYDLAAMAEIECLPQAKTHGLARYLVESNAHLGRSLRMRYMRWHKSWSVADGIVNPDTGTLELLRESRLAMRSYSPTALQQFATCPYRFLLYAIHRFREREASVALEQMDPRTRGELFHRTQFELLRQMKQGGMLPVNPGNLKAALDLADSVLDRVAARYEEELAPAIERVWASEVENLRTDLRGWLRETAAYQLDWVPARFEFGFGLPLEEGHDEASTEEEVIVDGARVRGSVDLVERHRNRPVLRITDHKTGKPPDPIPAYVGGGSMLQPVLYAMAVEQLLGEPVESGRLSYCTQRGNFTDVQIRITPQARRHMQEVLTTIDAAIDKGFLPAAPKKDACGICEYRPVCGPYEETRVRRKQRNRLEPLRGLRELL